jgi:hypothetical protein
MKYALVLGLIALAVIGRLIPHPDNFTPVLAVALFAGALLPARLAYVVPLVAVALSDLFIGTPLDASSFAVYGALAASTGLGQWLGKRRTWGRTAGVAFVSSVLFFVVTNFAVWAMGVLYPRTLEGLAQCYVMAIPFFRNELAGTFFWTFVLFGIYEIARQRFPRVSSQSLT